jgi:hypothetical protein
VGVDDSELLGNVVVSAAAAGTAPPTSNSPSSTELCAREPAGNGRKISAGLSLAGRSGRSRATLTTDYGRRARVSGKLVNGDGTPVADAKVRVCAQEDAAGAAPAVLDTVTTDAQGQYQYVLPSGPSRRLWLLHPADDGAIVADATLSVRPRVTLGPAGARLRNGQQLVLRGRLSGPVPSRGVFVLLQVWRGSYWQTFTSTRSRTSGTFRASYRFRRTVGAAHYKMRALLPDQSSYAYALGASRPVTVNVRG